MHPIIPLLQLLHVVGRIEGRKRLQKMVHILQELGAGFQEPFQYSFYGMYSLQLKSEIDILQDEKLLTEVNINGGFTVVPRPELEQLLGKFELTEQPEWANHARQLNALSPAMLEGISTILYLRHTEPNKTAVRERLLMLKPHLDRCVEECFREADSLPHSVSSIFAGGAS